MSAKAFAYTLAAAIGAAFVGPSGASAQALDPVALGRIGSTSGAVPSGVSVGQALKALRSGASASSLSGLGGGQISIDTVGRPPLNDLTAYRGAGLSTGTGDYTRELGPGDMTRVAPALSLPDTALLGQDVAAGGGGRSLNLGSGGSSGSRGGASAGAGAGGGGLGSLLPAGAGAAFGLSGSSLGR